MRTGLRKTIYRLKRYFTSDRIIFSLAILFCLAWTWGAISSMSRNWELEQRLVSKEREKRLLELEVETAILENEYYASEEYQELAAKAKQNKIGDGEFMVYLPKNSEAAKSKHQVVATESHAEQLTNFQQWLSFILGI